MYDPKTQISPRYEHNRNHTSDIRKATKLVQNYDTSDLRKNFVDEEVVQFRPNQHQESMESDDSGVCSPPLWKNNGPSPPKSPSQPLLGHHSYRTPNSRAQAIAKGQWELMEMVKNMPESSYELSLKDLVEHQKIESQIPQSLQQRGVVKVKRQESKTNEKNVMRSGSFETKGMFLNMVIPFSLKSKKKKNFVSNSSGKVSPKPSEGLKSERDWWKKKFTGSSDSDSSRTTNNSATSDSTRSSSGGSSDRSNRGSRKKNGFLTGCWSFFQSRKSRPVE
ncbi:hypothetical protein ACJIZ3_002878 [Penstemon smallii]|uniref:Uncharacterized protein n=1 Tax=Penstemon smallii TaxID=265156 RepID=A0ABD3U913_9LAMI